MKADRYGSTSLVANNKFHPNEEFNIDDFSQEAPVLSGHVREPVRGIIEGQVDTVLMGEAGKCRECLIVPEVCELHILPGLLILYETAWEMLLFRCRRNMAHTRSSLSFRLGTGAFAAAIGYVLVEGRVTPMLL
jgi:hypothetical protein